MELQSMQAKSRKESSKPMKKAWRRDGYIPSVLYGGEGDNVLLALDEKTWLKFFEEQGASNLILDLIIDDKKSDPELIKVGEIQRHPVNGNILHVDLIRLARGVVAIFEVPLKFTGKSEGEKAGGIFAKHTTVLEVECIPRNVPDYIEIDITSFELNQQMRVNDLEYDNPDVKIVTEESRLIFSIEIPRIVEEPTAEVIEGEEVEGEEVEKAEGGEAEGQKGEAEKKEDKKDKKDRK